jgi:hypothetical protein
MVNKSAKKQLSASRASRLNVAQLARMLAEKSSAEQ